MLVRKYCKVIIRRSSRLVPIIMRIMYFFRHGMKQVALQFEEREGWTDLCDEAAPQLTVDRLMTSFVAW
jgi:hypothetical protein